ncbi:MAG: flagellar hook-associated protein FlgK [Sandaracinus sp.]|nr:flagellar hook-associated protein FlgK [Sandaracinus sp.]MCB9632480.1 flagellar hook-associated protein FlgK [Sandaracinus sp.]
MSLFGLLGTGRNGMVAAQGATSVTSHNATNASTPGYTRRAARLEPVLGPPEPGAGSRMVGSRRVIDPFVERRMLGALSARGESSARAGALSALDTIFADSSSDVGAALDSLRSAFGDLASHPSDPTARESVLSRARGVVDAFGAASDQLAWAREDANTRVEGEVQEVNERLRRIGELGRDIAKAEVAGHEASDLRDLRDQLVREVSERVPVQVLDTADGGISLTLDGAVSLVSADGEVSELSTRRVGADVLVEVSSSGARTDARPFLESGRIGGLLDARDGAIADARGALDQLAADVANAYSDAHAAGFGLDGVGGRDFFTRPGAVDGAARQLSLAAGLNADTLAAASDAAELPGDNRGALALAGVSDALVADGGTRTLMDAYAGLVGRAGMAVSDAYLRQDAASAAVDQVEALRESVSGVSVDEEMVDLVRFQRGYQAALKVVQTADEMLGELMNLKR